ncbi:MAG: hypothetical protein ATN34_00925 [Epulopiscium sp. Nele67-Bin002]|nr:MAG: hypothetical protein ATN34_00925 [Epulopiscium sp. Nele67-Bin002]OON94542.1 MAG: hypothetical protein ATN33_04280 [Epulopiscium sp. Nele67-Bin001]
MDEIKVGKIIKHISISIDKHTNSLLREKDLSMAQALVLVWLSENKEHKLPIKFIEKMSNTAQSTTFGVISRLANKGFVTTYISENRTKVVEITEAGLELIDFIRECISTSEKVMFTSFTKGEYMIFTELLSKIETNVEQYRDIN